MDSVTCEKRVPIAIGRITLRNFSKKITKRRTPAPARRTNMTIIDQSSRGYSIRANRLNEPNRGVNNPRLGYRIARYKTVTTVGNPARGINKTEIAVDVFYRTPGNFHNSITRFRCVFFLFISFSIIIAFISLLYRVIKPIAYTRARALYI